MSPRAGLDRTRIAQAAAELADLEGLEQVTLARLAERLGIRSPSLYNHVDGLTGLRREVTLLGLRELGSLLGRAAVGKAGDDAVRGIAAAYRAYARQHPGRYQAMQTAPAAADAELQELAGLLVGIVADVLAAYGLRDDEAIHAVRALRSTLHGFVSLETAGGFGLPLDLDESYRRLVEILIAGLHQQANSAAE